MSIRNVPFLVAGCIALFGMQSAQAGIVEFFLEGQAGLGLLPGNEVPPAQSNGSGGVLTGIFFDDATNDLFIDVGWGSGNGFTDMTGNAVAMHIHGPADFFSNAGVLYPLDGLAGFDPSASDGGFIGSVTINAVDVSDLLNGLLYLNVHTAVNPPGELRGNMVLVPAPSSLLILGLAGTPVFMRRRRRI